MEFNISINDHSLVKLHVTALEEMTSIDEAVFATDAPTSRPPNECGGGTGFIFDKNPFLDKYPEIYPARARENHIKGTVVIAGIINREGYLDGLTVLESPDDSLSAATLRYYRRHRGPSQPSLEDSQPVECQWSHMDNYSLSK